MREGPPSCGGPPVVEAAPADPRQRTRDTDRRPRTATQTGASGRPRVRCLRSIARVTKSARSARASKRNGCEHAHSVHTAPGLVKQVLLFARPAWGAARKHRGTATIDGMPQVRRRRAPKEGSGRRAGGGGAAGERESGHRIGGRHAAGEQRASSLMPRAESLRRTSNGEQGGAEAHQGRNGRAIGGGGAVSMRRTRNGRAGARVRRREASGGAWRASGSKRVLQEDAGSHFTDGAPGPARCRDPGRCRSNRARSPSGSSNADGEGGATNI